MNEAVLDDRDVGLPPDTFQTDPNLNSTFIALPERERGSLCHVGSVVRDSRQAWIPSRAGGDGAGDGVESAKTIRNRTHQSAKSLVGTRIRQFHLLELLGNGGMGTVYKARHTQLGRLVAIKLVKAGQLRNHDAFDRFRREMRAIGPLNHPNIARAIDAGEVEGTCYLAMDLVSGPNLAELVERVGRLCVSEACELVCQAAAAIAAAHEKDIVHRDIKPANLLLDADGQLKLTDFGLAILKGDADSLDSPPDMTAIGQILGTAYYMAPEQAMDAHAVDRRADIYSLGCTLFYLLTGNPPYWRPGETGVLRAILRHAHDPIPDVREVRPEVPVGLVRVLEQMLEKSPADRPGAEDTLTLLSPYRRNSNVIGLWHRWLSGAPEPVTSSPCGSLHE